MKRRPEAGMTLIEVLVAVMLVSVLSLGMVYAIRLGIDTMSKVNDRFQDERRHVGAQRILEQQLANIALVSADCRAGEGAQVVRVSFFEGEPAALRVVSSYSLQDAHRGPAEVLEYQVIPGDAEHGGVRLVVNEYPYSGPAALGRTCYGQTRDPIENLNVTRWAPIIVSPQSFVLADRLSYCRMAYLQRKTTQPNPGERWLPRWVFPDPPAAIRIEMAPMEDSKARLRALSLTIPVHVNRKFGESYTD